MNREGCGFAIMMAGQIGHRACISHWLAVSWSLFNWCGWRSSPDIPNRIWPSYWNVEKQNWCRKEKERECSWRWNRQSIIFVKVFFPRRNCNLLWILFNCLEVDLIFLKFKIFDFHHITASEKQDNWILIRGWNLSFDPNSVGFDQRDCKGSNQSWSLYTWPWNARPYYFYYSGIFEWSHNGILLIFGNYAMVPSFLLCGHTQFRRHGLWRSALL